MRFRSIYNITKLNFIKFREKFSLKYSQTYMNISRLWYNVCCLIATFFINVIQFWRDKPIKQGSNSDLRPIFTAMFCKHFSFPRNISVPVNSNKTCISSCENLLPSNQINMIPNVQTINSACILTLHDKPKESWATFPRAVPWKEHLKLTKRVSLKVCSYHSGGGGGGGLVMFVRNLRLRHQKSMHTHVYSLFITSQKQQLFKQ